MRIKEGIVKIVTGTKGNTLHKWWRISRTDLESVAFRLSSVDNFYYAHIYEYTKGKRTGKRKTKTGRTKYTHEKGTVGNKIAFVYWDKSGLLMYKRQ